MTKVLSAVIVPVLSPPTAGGAATIPGGPFSVGAVRAMSPGTNLLGGYGFCAQGLPQGTTLFPWARS
jgi:hypothetical protein